MCIHTHKRPQTSNLSYRDHFPLSNQFSMNAIQATKVKSRIKSRIKMFLSLWLRWWEFRLGLKAHQYVSRSCCSRRRHSMGFCWSPLVLALPSRCTVERADELDPRPDGAATSQCTCRNLYCRRKVQNHRVFQRGQEQIIKK